MVREGKQPAGTKSGNRILQCCLYKPSSPRKETFRAIRRDLDSEQVWAHLLDSMMAMLSSLNTIVADGADIVSRVLDNDADYDLLEPHSTNPPTPRIIQNLPVSVHYEIGMRPELADTSPDDNNPFPKHMTIVCKDTTVHVQRQRVVVVWSDAAVRCTVTV